MNNLTADVIKNESKDTFNVGSVATKKESDNNKESSTMLMKHD